jgi:hypothetical protein
MSQEFIYKAALSAVLYEAEKLGVDLETLKANAHAGLMGDRIYAPPSAADKPKSVRALEEGLDQAKNYLEIK